MRFQSVAEGFAYLEGFANFEKKSPAVREYSLERMQALLDAWDNPHLACRVIHIAGSKGKGSTAAYMAALLGALGHSTGIYASPHVLDWRERIRPGTGFYADAVYRDTLQGIHDFVEGLGPAWSHGRPTTFELLTLAAFLIFRQAAPDWVVLETGLGGRLDATNLVRPALCLITDLELEHVEVLGPTLSHIAREKAGIFKPGVPVCSQAQTPEARQILDDRARELGCSLEYLAPDWVVPGGLPGQHNLRLPGLAGLEVRPAMPGDFQARNLGLALLGAVRLCQTGALTVPAASLGRACLVAAATRLPARLEYYQAPPGSGRPDVLLDAGHTVTSVRHLVAWVQEHLACGTGDRRRPVHLLVALAKDKDASQIAAQLAGLPASITVTRPGYFKESAPQALVAALRATGLTQDIQLVEDPVPALDQVLDRCRLEDPGARGLAVVCGSFYLCGAVQPHLLELGYTTGEHA